MKRELFRAKEYDQDNWIVSDSLSWMDNELYLFGESDWLQCEYRTRSVSYENMVGKKW